MWQACDQFCFIVIIFGHVTQNQLCGLYQWHLVTYIFMLGSDLFTQQDIVLARTFTVGILIRYSAPPSKNAVCTYQITCRRNQQTINTLPQLKAISSISNIYTYNLSAWEWVDLKFDVEWKYLLCFIVAHTAFLLDRAVLGVLLPPGDAQYVIPGNV